MRKLLGKKAQAFTIADLGTIAIALVVAAVILGMGATILSKLKELQTVNGTAFNASTSGITGLTTILEHHP